MWLIVLQFSHIAIISTMLFFLVGARRKREGREKEERRKREGREKEERRKREGREKEERRKREGREYHMFKNVKI